MTGSEQEMVECLKKQQGIDATQLIEDILVEELAKVKIKEKIKVREEKINTLLDDK